MWMARSESSVAAAVNASTNASIIGWFSELRRDGRSSVTRRTSPSRDVVTAPSSVTVESAILRYTVGHTVLLSCRS
jgi:hypothetical protein